jgi:ribosomal protein L44E
MNNKNKNNNSKTTNTKQHLVYECKECKNHYLSLIGIKMHVETMHKVYGEEANNLWTFVPFGATEFD